MHCITSLCSSDAEFDAVVSLEEAVAAGPSARSVTDSLDDIFRKDKHDPRNLIEGCLDKILHLQRELDQLRLQSAATNTPRGTAGLGSKRDAAAAAGRRKGMTGWP